MLINKSLKLEKRILSGGKNLDNMRFILGIFTNLYDRFNFLPNLVHMTNKVNLKNCLKFLYKNDKVSNLVTSRMHRPNLNHIFIRYIV